MLWFRDETHYLAFQGVCIDGDSFLAYAAWLSNAENIANQLEAGGAIVRKVYADPGEFVAWCRVNARDTAAKSREAFAVVQSRNGPNDEITASGAV